MSGSATTEAFATALLRGAPPDELLDLADSAIEDAAAAHDTAALRRLARHLDSAAATLGASGRGLHIAAARARAALPLAAETARPEPREPLPRSAPAAPAAVPCYAGWGSRAGAFLIDWAVLAAGFAALAATSDALAALFVFFGPFAYFTILHAVDGATVGKHVVGIEVRLVDGRRLNPAAAVGRSVTQLILVAVVLGFVLDSLWPLWDARRQTLHDKAAGTIVTRTRTVRERRSSPERSTQGADPKSC